MSALLSLDPATAGIEAVVNDRMGGGGDRLAHVGIAAKEEDETFVKAAHTALAYQRGFSFARGGS